MSFIAMQSHSKPDSNSTRAELVMPFIAMQATLENNDPQVNVEDSDSPFSSVLQLNVCNESFSAGTVGRPRPFIKPPIEPLIDSIRDTVEESFCAIDSETNSNKAVVILLWFILCY